LIVPFKPGQRLRSEVCTTEVIVVSSASGDLDLRCGGMPLVEFGTELAAEKPPAAGLDTGTQIGKRYISGAEQRLELLVTKQGTGALSVGDTPLVAKEAKPLPSSD
jgi:hypothetical protein